MPRRPVSINTRDRGLASVYRCSPGEQSCTASDNINLLCQLLAAWQAGTGTSSLAVARAAWAAGGARGLYSGGTATLAREVPFSLIQFPLLGGPEGAGVRGEGRALLPPGVRGGGGHGGRCPHQPHGCGEDSSDAAAGGAPGGRFSGASEGDSEQGVAGLAAGLLPRLLWVSLGGVIFFGVYEHTLAGLTRSGGADS